MYIQQKLSNNYALVATAMAASVAMPASGQGTVYYMTPPPAVQCAEAVASSQASSPGLLKTCEAAMRDRTLPGDIRAASMVNAGIVLMRRGDTDAAKALFDDARALESDLPGLLVNISAAEIRAGEHREALDTLAVISQVPSDLTHVAYYNRGLANWHLGHVEAAYSDFSRSREIVPDYEPALEALTHFILGSENNQTVQFLTD